METQPRSTSQFNWMQNCLMVFTALLPFVYLAKGVDPVLLPRQLILSVLLILFAGGFIFKLTKGLKIQSIIPILFVLLSIVYWVSTFQAINTVESCYIALKISVFVAFFFVMYIGIKEQFFTIQLISLGFAISGIITVGLAVRDMFFLQSQGINIFSDDNMYKVNATFGHKNLLSAFLFLCLPMLAIQLLFATKCIWKLLISIGLISMIVVIVLLQTRAVLVAGFICLCGALFLIFKTKIGSTTHRKIGIGLLLGLLVLSIAASYVYWEKLTHITRTESFIERKHVWENTWQMIAENPLTGVGAANWQIHFPKYGMQKFYDVNYTITEGLTNFQRPHNDFLWVWAETGSIGLLVYALLFILVSWFAYRLCIKEQDFKTQLLYGLILLQILGFVTISLFDFPLERIEHPVVIFSSIAYIAAVSPSKTLHVKIPKWSLLLLVLLGLYTVFICNKRWQSELVLRKMYKAHATGDWNKLISEGKKIQTAYFNMDYYSIPVSWYVGVGYFTQNKLPLAKHYFEEAYALHPYQVHVLNNYGACYEKEGNQIKAIELLEVAHQISPTFSDGIINLSGAYYNAGRYDDAFATITQFKYDEQNERFKVFVLAIVKKKIEQTILETSKGVFRTFLTQLLTDDKMILELYKQAQQKHMDVLSFFEQKAPLKNK